MVNNMKTYIRQMAQIISVLLMIVLNSSCLTGGLDELESFDDTDLKNFQFEYRWERPLNETNPNNTQLGVVSLATDCKIEAMSSIVPSQFPKQVIRVCLLKAYVLR